MENRITSEEVANQFAKSVKLLLEWIRQEKCVPSHIQNVKPEPSREGNIEQIMPDTKRLLKASEVAERLQISRTQAYRLMKIGEIPAIRVGSSVRVKRSDLEEYIEKNMTT
jgi:excisionase family DNA binding protein